MPIALASSTGPVRLEPAPARAGLADYDVEVDGRAASGAIGECNESNNGDTLLQTGCGVD